MGRSLVMPNRTAVGAVLLALILVVQAYLVMRWSAGRVSHVTVNYGFAIEIGLLVGATEMMSRYRDEPFAPLISVAGLFYMMVNGGAAALAYYLMTLGRIPATEPLRTLAAGVGAMAFLRSGLFTVRYGTTDVAVGPNQILQTILNSLDRTYDRQRAVPRSDAITRIMGGIAFDQVKDALPALCFDLMQNVSEAEVAGIVAQVRELSASPTISDDAKTLSLGLALINIVGEKTLAAAVDAMGKNAEGFRQLGEQMLIDLAAIDPEVAAAKLPSVCAELPTPRKGEAGTPVPSFEVQTEGLSAESRAVLVLYKLIACYGEQRVSAALAVLASEGSSEAEPDAERGGTS